MKKLRTKAQILARLADIECQLEGPQEDWMRPLVEESAELMARLTRMTRSCPHEAWETDSAGKPAKCADCGDDLTTAERLVRTQKSAAVDPVPEALSAMPECLDRRPYDEDALPGYFESNRDWAERNNEAVEWLADNHVAIREALFPTSTKHLRWGDVLCAAMDACQAVGVRETIEERELAGKIREILGVTGGMDSAYERSKA